MAEVSFGKQEGSAPAPVIAPVAAPVVNAIPTVVPTPIVNETTTVATVSKPGALAPSGLVLGDKLPELKDIILPRINIVQGIGKLQETFPKGALVFGQNTILFEPPQVNGQGVQTKPGSPPVILTVLGFRPTRFVEKIEGGDRGLIVNTEEEVTAAGGTLDFNEWKLKKGAGMKRFEPLAEAMVAIRRPDCCADDDTIFVYEADGHKYALAIWAMKGTSYTAAAKKVFFTARAIGALRNGYPTHCYATTTRLEKYPGGNAAWIPVCLPHAKSTDKFMEFVRSILAS